MVLNLSSVKQALQNIGEAGTEASAKAIQALFENMPDTETLLQIGVDPSSIEAFNKSKQEIGEISSRLEELKKKKVSINITSISSYRAMKALNEEIAETTTLLEESESAARGLGESLIEGVTSVADIVRAADTQLRDGKQGIAIQEKVIGLLKENKSLSENTTRAAIAAENEKIRLQILLNEKRADYLKRSVTELMSDKDRASVVLEISLLYQDIALMQAQSSTELGVQVELAKNKVTVLEEQQKFEKSSLDLLKKQYEFAARSRRALTDVLRSQLELNAARANRELDYREQIVLANIEKDNKIAAAEQAATIKRAEIELEYALLDVKFALLEAEIEAAYEQNRLVGDSYNKAKGSLATARSILSGASSTQDISASAKLAVQIQLEGAKEAGKISQSVYNDIVRMLTGVALPVIEDPSLDARLGLTVEEVRAAREAGQIIETSSASAAEKILRARTAIIPEDPSTQDRLDFLTQYLNTAVQVKAITRETANEFLAILSKAPKSLKNLEISAVNTEESSAKTVANNENETANIKAVRREQELKYELMNTLADMQEASGSVRLAQIVQEGETLQGVYKQLGESQTADSLRRHVLELKLADELKLAKADEARTGKKSTEAEIRILAIQADIERLDASARAMAISSVRSFAELYRANGRERLALEYDLGAVRAELVQQEALMQANGNAEALAQLNSLYAQLAELRRAQQEFAAETAKRLGGEGAGNMASLGAAASVHSGPGGAFEADPKTGELTSSMSERIGALSSEASQTMDILREIGGDGPLIASVSEAAFNISESWSIAFEKLGEDASNWESKMGQVAAVASAVGATISAIGSIQAASSERRVAGIESEIEAEKNRDGKSAQSKAKIAALEAKAEREKRKAFERDKKMKMAEIVMNTAAAIMSNMASPWPANFIFAALAGAMGAMQLAAVASTSYSGGGSSAPSGPTSISLGQRSSTIDLAKSKSASGELGYMRGESGTGNITQFKPAFTGIKHRATGGATTGYIVGEQGPELWVPETPGTVIPNDEIQMSPSQNVNFTIQAVDASGVEQLLVKQKGHIIRMIREAANSYGTPFLEEVNVGVYTPQTQGASRA
jgi:hypothetical protein